MNCSKCGKELRSDNTKGICGQAKACSERAAGGGSSKPASPRRARASTPPDADDAVLDRVGLGESKPDEAPPTSKAEAHAAVERDETWLAKFYRLHEALGLDPEEAIEQHCRAWVEMTTARALGKSVFELAAEKVDEVLASKREAAGE